MIVTTARVSVGLETRKVWPKVQRAVQEGKLSAKAEIEKVPGLIGTLTTGSIGKLCSKTPGNVQVVPDHQL